MDRDRPPRGLDAIGRAMRAEWRAEQEEITRAAYEQWRHGRTLAELLAECAGRGDAIHVTVADATFHGPVHAIGPDRFTIATGSGPVDVALGAPMVLGIERDAAATADTPIPGTSMRARLLEHETAGFTVILGTMTTQVRGTLVVGVDHVVVSHDGLDRIVPLDAIVWVRTDAPEPSGRP